MFAPKNSRTRQDGLSFILVFLYMLGFLVLGAFLAVVIVSIKVNSLSDLGSLGDSLNGTTAPIIGLMIVVVTFLAFWVQFEANQELRKDIKIDRFETRFYELLRLHQANVASIDIASKFQGRKAFVRMYLEIRFLYGFIESQADRWNQNEKKPPIKIDKRSFMEMAYTIFFYGLKEVSPRKNFVFSHSLHTPFLIAALRELRKIKRESKTMTVAGKVTFNLKVESSPSLGKLTWKPSYSPFDGHVSKLGHYYRHLYQLIKFVSTNTTLGLLFKDKYAYIKMIRAQLSNHEQALIYFNSFSRAGNIWWRETNTEFKNDKGEVISYFLDYRIIKNIPFNLTRFGPDPVEEFKSELIKRSRTDQEINLELEELFEWIGG